MKNFIQPGTMVTVPAPAAVTSGGVVIVGSLIGIAAYDAEMSADVEICTEGVFELPKVSTEAWTVGAVIYWDADPGEATTVATDNTRIGVAVAAAANPSVVGRVRLDG